MWWLIGGLAATALAAAIAARLRLVVVTVQGQSMEPTHPDGQRLLVRRRRLHAVRRGDIVVVAAPASWRAGPDGDGPTRAAATVDRGRAADPWLVKRVAAVPGDRLTGLPPMPGVDPAAVVPDGHLVLLGDNPDRSHDSRHVGCFPARTLLGVVVRALRDPDSGVGAPVRRPTGARPCEPPGI